MNNWDMVKNVAKRMEKQNPEWRYGQCLFNALEHVDPETANKIRGTKDDCFYDDELATAFVTRMIELWYGGK